MSKHPLVARIYAAYEAAEAAEAPRAYLGASSIGEECERKLWYRFRGLERAEFPGRILRMFQHGHMEEARVVANLRATGLAVYHAGEKQARLSAFSGLFAGHPDGVVFEDEFGEGDGVLLEVKTANKRRWEELQKKGVQKARPLHYAQMQAYMGMLQASDEYPSAFTALYVCVCKNDERMYAEEVEFIPQVFEDIGQRARRILEAEEPPERVAASPSDTAGNRNCTYCDSCRVCWEGHAPARVCGGCANFQIDVDAGTRTCMLSDTPTEQHSSCDEFELLDALSGPALEWPVMF